MNNESEGEEIRVTEHYSPPLHGDVLDSVVRHFPTLDLLPASRVSSAWRLSVASSLRRSPRLKPLLLLRRGSHPASPLAYDPYSRTWAPLPCPPPRDPLLPCPPPVRSSLPSGPLYSLSPSRLSVSPRPLAATWLHLPPPRVSRTDPAVALVGPSSLVVAGGASDFEDLPLAVEVLDLRHPSAGWTMADPLPEELAQSSSATWLSVATSDDRLFVLDKDSGTFSSFEPETGTWSRTCELKPDPKVHLSAIGFSNGRLLLAGLSGTHPDPIRLRIWEVSLGVDADPAGFTEIGRMPGEMLEGLAGSGFGLTTIGFGLVGDFGYFYNPGDFSEGAVFWEISGERWERVERPEALDEDPTARIVFGCATVGLGDFKELFETHS